MNPATAKRVEQALERLAIEGIYFNAEYETNDFWSVQEGSPEAQNWSCYLDKLELGNKNYRLIPKEGVSLVYLGQRTPNFEKTIHYYIVEIPEGLSFSISHHVDLGIDDGFIIGKLDLIPDYLVAKLVEKS